MRFSCCCCSDRFPHELDESDGASVCSPRGKREEGVEMRRNTQDPKIQREHGAKDTPRASLAKGNLKARADSTSG